jgi:hypothetical protein
MIEKALRAKLKSLSNGAEVYPLAAPKDATTPYVVYSRQGTGRVPTLTEQGMHKPTFQITIAEQSYSKMLTLRTNIRNGIEFQTGSFAVETPIVLNTIITNENEFYEPETKEFIGILEIELIHN